MPREKLSKSVILNSQREFVAVCGNARFVLAYLQQQIGFQFEFRHSSEYTYSAERVAEWVRAGSFGSNPGTVYS